MQHEALQKVESEQNEFIEQFILQKWLEYQVRTLSIIHSLPLIWTPGHKAKALITAPLRLDVPNHLNMETIWTWIQYGSTQCKPVALK